MQSPMVIQHMHLVSTYISKSQIMAVVVGPGRFEHVPQTRLQTAKHSVSPTNPEMQYTKSFVDFSQLRVFCYSSILFVLPRPRP